MIGGLRAITFDFGNTLVPFPASPMASIVSRTAERAAGLLGCAADDWIEAWGEERLRQFDEDVPEGREADLDVRTVRVMARMRGRPVPGPGARWDDRALVGYAPADEVAGILGTYANAFLDSTPIPPAIGPMLERLALTYRLGLISNWPLALSIERFVEVAGWTPYLSSIVVSQRVGFIKPRPEIFRIAASELGVASGPAILHVGDDPGADVVGAAAVGWRTAWVRRKPEDSPLPTAAPAPDARPDLTLDSVLELERALGTA